MGGIRWGQRNFTDVTESQASSPLLGGPESMHGYVHTHTHPLQVPCRTCSNLLQLVEVFTLAQQPAQRLHMLLAEAAVSKPAAGREMGSLSWVWPRSSNGASLKLGLSRNIQYPPVPPPPPSRSHICFLFEGMVLKVGSLTSPNSTPLGAW